MRPTFLRLATAINTPTATTRALPTLPPSHSKPPVPQPIKPRIPVPTNSNNLPTSSPSASTSSKSTSKSKEPPLTLEHFLLRSRTLSLYRTIVRAIYAIPDPAGRKDPMAHVKGEFERHRNERDTGKIRYLASTGKAEWEGMRRYVEDLAVMAKKEKE